MLNHLSIPQEFVLLALDRETNKLKSMFRMHVALYTLIACIMELSINGNVTFEDDDTVRISDSASTGEKYLDRLIEIMAAEKPKKLTKWVSYFYYRQKEIYKLVVESLVDKGVLEIENTVFY
ncbi:GPP34 family phosphoprotein [Paenibacillus sp. OV219]|uniref:GOLPH3/VPS74 family protein n=1 Tax=Paenibacillus sp. OV219 TaxID=1884377 RepID=UPI0015A72D02|nr:GPP34 family phosphoprotein [Paenibacillus sp. OV219]